MTASNIGMLNGLLMNFGTDVFRFSRRPTTSLAPVFAHARVRATTAHESTEHVERQERQALRIWRAPAVDESSALPRIDERPALRAASARRAPTPGPAPRKRRARGLLNGTSHVDPH